MGMTEYIDCLSPSHQFIQQKSTNGHHYGRCASEETRYADKTPNPLSIPVSLDFFTMYLKEVSF
jgi:hypothetical protein